MRKLLVGLFLAALLASPAYAQESGQIEPGRFLVYFDTDQATLGPGATQVVTEAAQAYQQTGAAQIEVIGYTDTTGSAEYNLALSQRRAETVADELIRQGVPATDIATIGRGEEDLLVPTGDGVNEPANRRVEIVVPPPAPVAEAAPEVEPAAPPEEEPRPFAFTIGPMYGHNFGENNDGGENDLAGAQLTFDVLPGFLGGVSLKQGLLWSFNGEDDGFTGRSVAGARARSGSGLRAADPRHQWRWRIRRGRPGRLRGRPRDRPGSRSYRKRRDARLRGLRLPVPPTGLGRRHPLGRPERRRPVLKRAPPWGAGRPRWAARHRESAAAAIEVYLILGGSRFSQ